MNKTPTAFKNAKELFCYLLENRKNKAINLITAEIIFFLDNGHLNKNCNLDNPDHFAPYFEPEILTRSWFAYVDTYGDWTIAQKLFNDERHFLSEVNTTAWALLRTFQLRVNQNQNYQRSVAS